MWQWLEQRMLYASKKNLSWFAAKKLLQKYAKNVISLTFKHMNTARENIQMSNK